MAVFEHFHNMYDVAFKPRLLRTLLKENVPHENHPFRGLSDLSTVFSAVKTHRLLSEFSSESVDQKHMDKWKSAVDSWVDRLLSLVSCNMPDKCWAGTCLLGLTCQECSSDRFLASYSVWFHKLLLHIQPAAESHFVKVASCASVSDLLTRLGGFPNVKKDGTAHAGKLIQPVLRLLNEDSSEAVWEGAIHLLCTIITSFPSSVYHHYDSVEATVAKLMSGKCSVTLLEKLPACLALLPKSRGDEDSWLLMMRKVLLSINVNLNEAFQGLEEEAKCNEAVRLLVPLGQDPPPPLGCQKISGEVLDKATRKCEWLPMSNVSTLMLCCCKMLTNSYPVQVNVPIRQLLALVGRVLMVDGSLSQALLPFVTAIQQEFICSQLPTLHSYSLDLLTTIMKSLQSQLLPYAADITRLMIEYFKICALPELRIKAYSVIKMLISRGIGIAVHLAQEVVNNAFADLDPIGHGIAGTSSSVNSNSCSEALQRTRHRKRKHAATINTGSSEVQLDRVNLEKEVLKSCPATPISLKIAAIDALKALLTVGGALRSEHWRSKVDLLLITEATNACKGGWANDEKVISLPGEPTSTHADLQYAALQALLASLLSPRHVRPPYLAQGLELFRRGKQETGTRVAELCSDALLYLELLIHPRALPLGDFPSINHNSFDDGANPNFPGSLYSGGQKFNMPSSKGRLGAAFGVPSPQYDLYDKWLGSDDDIDVPVTDPGKNMDNVEEPSEASEDHLTEKFPSADGPTSTEVAEKIDQSAAAGADKREGGIGEEIMVEAHQFPESSSQVDVTFPVVVNGTTGTKIEIGKIVSDSGVLDPGDSEMATGNDFSVAKGDRIATIGEDTSTAISNSERAKGFVAELDNDSSMDSFPDIVDADPDSELE